MTVHLAAPPKGLVQRCAICGEILTDYRGAQGVGDWKPMWWEGEVRIVKHDGRRIGASSVVGPADCTRRDA